MKATVTGGDVFRTQIEVTHPTLRRMMGLNKGEEAFHDVQVSFTQDPVTLQKIYIIAQIDVTSAVLAKREVLEAHAKLEQEKIRSQALIRRQYELIECLGWVSDVGSSAGTQKASELIAGVRRQISESLLIDDDGKVELGSLLGTGSVSLGHLILQIILKGNDACITVKTMHLVGAWDMNIKLAGHFTYSLARCTRGGGGRKMSPSSPFTYRPRCSGIRRRRGWR